MQQHLCHLLTFALVAASACIITPCQAQSKDSKSDNPISATNKASSSELNDSGAIKPVPSQEPVSQVPSENTPVTKPPSRIPIFSRIFPAPSMQQ
jgi:hypothetical protein